MESLCYWYEMIYKQNKLNFIMEEKYEKPVVNIFMTELRNSILDYTGGYNPPEEDEDE